MGVRLYHRMSDSAIVELTCIYGPRNCSNASRLQGTDEMMEWGKSFPSTPKLSSTTPYPTIKPLPAPPEEPSAGVLSLLAPAKISPRHAQSIFFLVGGWDKPPIPVGLWDRALSPIPI